MAFPLDPRAPGGPTRSDALREDQTRGARGRALEAERRKLTAGLSPDAIGAGLAALERFANGGRA